MNGITLGTSSDQIPLLFAMMMGKVTDEVRLESLWMMMSADDTGICNGWRTSFMDVGMEAMQTVGVTEEDTWCVVG